MCACAEAGAGEGEEREDSEAGHSVSGTRWKLRTKTQPTSRRSQMPRWRVLHRNGNERQLSSSGSRASVRLCSSCGALPKPLLKCDFHLSLTRPSPNPRQSLSCLLARSHSACSQRTFSKSRLRQGLTSHSRAGSTTPIPHSIMKPRDYCCCAIPTVNAGIYATLLEQFTLGIVAGTLSVATPSSEYYPLHRLVAQLTPLRSCRSRDLFSCEMGVCNNLLCGGRRTTPRLHWRLSGQSHAGSSNPS